MPPPRQPKRTLRVILKELDEIRRTMRETEEAIQNLAEEIEAIANDEDD